MGDIHNEPAYSKNVIEMITVANDFCMFLENLENKEPDAVLDYLQKVSPLLYLKGSLLPKVIVDDPEAYERFVNEMQYEEVFNNLRGKIGDLDQFWFIDHSGPDENIPVKGSISESFTDVYQDLKDFLMLYQKSSRAAKQNAVNECSKLYKSHWGHHLLTGLRALHDACFDDESEDEYQD